MKNTDSTIKFNVDLDKSKKVKDTLSEVFAALNEKGYNPISQMVGYIISGDPTYITSHNNARSIIRKVERDEILEKKMKKYLVDN